MSVYTAMFSALAGGASGLASYFTAQDERNFSKEMQANQFAQQNAYQSQQYGYNSELSKQSSEQTMAQDRQKAALAGYTTASAAFSRSASNTNRVTSGTSTATGDVRATANAAFDNLYKNFTREGQTPRSNAATQHVETADAASGEGGSSFGGIQVNSLPTESREITPTAHRKELAATSSAATGTGSTSQSDLSPVESSATTSGSGTSSGSDKFQLSDANVGATSV